MTTHFQSSHQFCVDFQFYILELNVKLHYFKQLTTVKVFFNNPSLSKCVVIAQFSIKAADCLRIAVK